MSTLAERVAARYLRQASWTSLNGKFVDIGYSPVKWQTTEMANGEPIPTTMSFTEARPAQHVYEMTTLKSVASRSVLYQLFPGVESVRADAHLHGDDKGPETRQKIIDAYKRYFQAVTASLKEEDSQGLLPAWEKLVPELVRKLVWKKIR